MNAGWRDEVPDAALLAKVKAEAIKRVPPKAHAVCAFINGARPWAPNVSNKNVQVCRRRALAAMEEGARVSGVTAFHAYDAPHGTAVLLIRWPDTEGVAVGVHDGLTRTLADAGRNLWQVNP